MAMLAKVTSVFLICIYLAMPSIQSLHHHHYHIGLGANFSKTIVYNNDKCRVCDSAFQKMVQETAPDSLVKLLGEHTDLSFVMMATAPPNRGNIDREANKGPPNIA